MEVNPEEYLNREFLSFAKKFGFSPSTSQPQQFNELRTTAVVHLLYSMVDTNRFASLDETKRLRIGGLSLQRRRMPVTTIVTTNKILTCLYRWQPGSTPTRLSREGFVAHRVLGRGFLFDNIF